MGGWSSSSSGGGSSITGATVDLTSLRPASDFNAKINFNFNNNGGATNLNAYFMYGGGNVVQMWVGGNFSYNFDGGGVRTTAMLGFTNSSANGFTTAFKENTAGVIEVNNGSAGTFRDLIARNVRTNATTVASLVAAATAGAGARSFVTDATATTFMTVVAGGGTNKVPVVCDGTNWLIG